MYSWNSSVSIEWNRILFGKKLQIYVFIILP